MTRAWRKEVIVTDRTFIPPLFKLPKDAIRFVQVRDSEVKAVPSKSHPAP